MKKLCLFGAMSVLASVSLLSCSDDDSKDKKQENPQEQANGVCQVLHGWSVRLRNTSAVPLNLTSKEQKAVDATNKFGTSLLAKVRKADENTMVSPFSMDVALAMLDNGAQDQVQKELAQALGWQNLSVDEINSLYSKISESLNSELDPTSVFETQNAFWIQEGDLVYKNFYNTLSDSYKASVSNLDFSKEGAADTIDAWANEATRGLIPHLDLGLTPSTFAVLSNACYFRADWTSKFQQDYSSVFTQGDGTVNNNAYMMADKGSFKTLYAETEGYKAVRLPYGNGTFCMDVVLPNEKSSTNILMNTIDWNNISFKDENVDLSLVRFKATNKHLLNEILSSMGISSLFNTTLDRIAPGTVLSKLQQNSYIEVDEAGTKAAAVTTAKLDRCAPLDVEFKEFVTNRPFLFAIREAKTGLILFMGEVVKADNHIPSSEE